jgi:hypothetical protein
VRTLLFSSAVLAVLSFGAIAHADDVPPPAPPPPPALKITPSGYVEGSYSYNFNQPSNGITNYRGYDNRHNTFTLENVAIGADWAAGAFEAKLMLQVGSTPTSYYSSEPDVARTSGANGSNASLWKYVQKAWVAYKAPVGRGLRLQLGLFLAPFGPESLAIKDSWNWSRSNLYYALPAYFTGVRARYEIADHWMLMGGVYNGWNTVVDNNDAKSVSTSIRYNADNVLAQLLYFGGAERPTGAPEGPYWRHDFDAFGQWDVTSHFSVAAHANAGWEPNRFGTSDWYAGAMYVRVKTFDWLYVALRDDAFWEDVASNANGTASAILWPVRWVSSQTVTLDARPTPDNLSVRLEYRHDSAQDRIFFRGDVVGDGNTVPYVPNARSQDTITLGATGWF